MKIFKLLICLLFIFPNGISIAQEAPNNYISFEDSDALHRFYQQDFKGVTPLVQGHRGTVENDLPENSIAALEYVLQKMPAVFEVDPRLTKDSVIVVFHDESLERTTDGTGKLIDHTWAEIQQLRLKNAKGELTEYKIPSLSEVLEWARGKTVLVLDKKNVPLQMIADIIREKDANNYVINMVRSTKDAQFYYEDETRRMFSVSIRTPEQFHAYMEAGIPKEQLFACIGTELTAETTALIRLLQSNGIPCLLATASSYDKLESRESRAEAYRKIADSGVSIIESNFPTEVRKALFNSKNK